jgi:DNA-binding LytR/AlgR family response regulator
MKLRCVAVDDEPFALEILSEYAERVPFLKMESLFSDPLEAMVTIQKMMPDLVFLDIQIPEISGIRIAEVIKRPTYVIFTTAYSEYAVEGFNLNAIDYLLKPFSFERFLKSVLKAQEIIQLQKQQMSSGTGNEFIIVKAGYQHIKIFISDIQYIEAMDNYVRIFTPLKTYTTLMTMKTVADLLPVNQFVRIHKSFIISIPKVTTFTREIVSIGKKQIPVGRAYISVFLASMQKEPQ